MYFLRICFLKQSIVIVCVIIVHYELFRFFKFDWKKLSNNFSEQFTYRTLKSIDDFDEIITNSDPFYIPLPNGICEE